MSSRERNAKRNFLNGEADSEEAFQSIHCLLCRVCQIIYTLGWCGSGSWHTMSHCCCQFPVCVRFRIAGLILSIIPKPYMTYFHADTHHVYSITGQLPIGCSSSRNPNKRRCFFFKSNNACMTCTTVALWASKEIVKCFARLKSSLLLLSANFGLRGRS